MRDAPSRLIAKRSPLLRPDDMAGADGILSGGRPRRQRRLRAIRRFAQVGLWTVPAMLVQTLLIVLPGQRHAANGFARVYWRGVCRLIGLKVRVIGTPVAGGRGRPVVFVSNHSSWLDIPALGGRLPGHFIAKSEIAGWPIVGLVARLGRSVFVTRQRGRTATERDSLTERLSRGDDLILFPEGTTSDGSRVLPFRSAFFAVAEGEAKPLIQPVSVVYDRLAGLPTGRACRPLFAWYGDMDIASHAWRLAQERGLRVTILLHTPIDPAHFPNRKALARAVWATVADGAATLRQNRPAKPLTATDDEEAGQETGEGAAGTAVFA